MKYLIGVFTVSFLFLSSSFLSSFSFSQSLQIDADSLIQKGSLNKFDYQIYMKYPKFSFGPDALMGVRGIASDMNLLIDSINKEHIRIFTDDLRTMEYNEEFKSMGTDLTTDYTVVYHFNSFVSISMLHYEMVAGMAHPLHFSYTFNYDYVNQGLISSLDQLFKPGSGYTKFISNYCKQDLKRQAKENDYTLDKDYLNQGTAYNKDNYKVFTIDENGLNIIFIVNQVGPYAIGEQTVKIPKGKLMKYLANDSPLNMWLKQ
jgi:hypothetical protein